MNNADKAYLELCEDILKNGVAKEDRTGTGTLSVFGRQMRFDLSEGFPLLTTKRVPFRIIAEELLFFVAGKTNLKELLEKNVDIWTRDGMAKANREEPSFGVEGYEEWSLDSFREYASHNDFDLGPIYGAQWRTWPDYTMPTHNGQYHTIDQLAIAVQELKYNPDSRRMIVSAWNPADLGEMALPPCHIMFQFYVADGKVSLQMYQRSSDVFLGLPFNIASYALLLEMVAGITDLDVGELIISIGDCHVYSNHVEQVKTQLSREPRPLPKLNLIVPKSKDIDDFTYDHFYLSGYDSHPALKGVQAY